MKGKNRPRSRNRAGKTGFTAVCAAALMFAVLCVGWTSVAVREAVAAEPSARVVVVDPAHGGSDPGVKLTDKLAEKNVTLAIAKLLQKDLASAPRLAVRLTRSDDRDLTAAELVKTAREAKADLFLSLHINAGFGRTASGYEFYFPGFSATASGSNTSEDILKDMAKNKHLNDSVRFAQILQKNLEGVFPRKSRWLREAPVPVLEGLGVPAVVLELGFATNTDDRKRITSEETWKAIARALAKSFRESF